jgi:predicted kinase
MKQVLILVRGLPGTIRTEFACKFAPSVIHFSVDSFMLYEGKYYYEAKKAEAASKWILQNVRECIADGHDVVVSDTFAKIADMMPYILMADEFGAELVVIEASSKSDKYSVPDELVADLRSQWESFPNLQ